MIGALIQTRMGSTRLPGKILKEVLGEPLLWHLCERLKFSEFIDEVIILTTEKKSDDPIVDFCKVNKLKYFRGSEYDVLDRHYQAAKKFKVDVIVRITSDCPLIDPQVTDRVIKYYLDNKGKFDYVSNCHPATYPDGLDTEVISFDILEEAWKNAKKPYEREHVTPYIWDNPEIFRIGNVEYKKDVSMEERWTLDYEEDYQFIKIVYKNLYEEGQIFSMGDILQLLKESPEIKKINEKYAGVNWYRKNLDDLKTIDESKTRTEK
ncbi:MAG: glycosyltransferase family protein [Nanoarchaeota archaeon]|nr:glycosyltransferase family protein [Nanoarchaeota archaeon]